VSHNRRIFYLPKPHASQCVVNTSTLFNFPSLLRIQLLSNQIFVPISRCRALLGDPQMKLDSASSCQRLRGGRRAQRSHLGHYSLCPSTCVLRIPMDHVTFSLSRSLLWPVYGDRNRAPRTTILLDLCLIKGNSVPGTKFTRCAKSYR